MTQFRQIVLFSFYRLRKQKVRKIKLVSKWFRTSKRQKRDLEPRILSPFWRSLHCRMQPFSHKRNKLTAMRLSCFCVTCFVFNVIRIFNVRSTPNKILSVQSSMVKYTHSVGQQSSSTFSFYITENLYPLNDSFLHFPLTSGSGQHHFTFWSYAFDYFRNLL